MPSDGSDDDGSAPTSPSTRRPRATAAAPPGYWGDGRGRCRPSQARVRCTRSAFGPSRTLELVACSTMREGETVLCEPALFTWDPELRALKPPPPSDDAEVTLAQRCVAVRKMMEKAPQLAPHCAGTLPLLHAYAVAHYRHRHGRGADPSGVWRLPWAIRDAGVSPEQMRTRAGFCVLAVKGLSGSPFADAFRDHNQLALLTVYADEGALPLPEASAGLFAFSSFARRLEPPAADASAARRRGPNCDYEIEADGTLTLRTTRRVELGEVISVPRGKAFAESKKKAPVEVFKDREAVQEALKAKAAQADASDVVKSFGMMEHPRIPPRLPPPGTLDLAARNVSGEAWREVLFGDPCGGGDAAPFALYIDYIFDGKESASLLGALSRRGKEVPVPFHIGFEEHAHRVEGADFAQVARLLFARVQSMLPPRLRGRPLTGAGAAGTLLRLGAGEELLRFSFDAVRCEQVPGETASEQLVMLPFCLCLNAIGRLRLHPPARGGVERPAHDVVAKPGRLILWSPDVEHEAPVITDGEAALFFADLAYSNPQPAAK